MSLQVQPKVAHALLTGAGVVALESTIICHGFPRPDNASVGIELQRAVRQTGAIPATIAVIEGVVRVGLSDDEIVRLAASETVAKCTARALPIVCAQGRDGATTVAATAAIAAQVGIEVFATGAIGGVHRGGQNSMDVSADLQALSRNPVMVVSSGAKSLLDPGRTLEALESHGVPVVGWRTDVFPAFYARDSGHPVPQRTDEIETLVRAWQVRRQLDLPGGLLLCQPISSDAALDHTLVQEWLKTAHARATRRGVSGGELTPFILDNLRQLSDGRTVDANRALAHANAALAGTIAVAIANHSAKEQL